jgi:hypothetical protein
LNPPPKADLPPPSVVDISRNHFEVWFVTGYGFMVLGQRDRVDAIDSLLQLEGGYAVGKVNDADFLRFEVHEPVGRKPFKSAPRAPGSPYNLNDQ